MQTSFLHTERAENRRQAKLERDNRYARTLLANLDYRPEDWDFTGEIIEDEDKRGVCSCGHEGLRYLFKIRDRRTGKTRIVGSSCIESYQDVNPRMVESIAAEMAAINQQINDRKRRAKAAAAEEVNRLGWRWVQWARVEALRALATEGGMRYIDGDPYWRARRLAGIDSPRDFSREVAEKAHAIMREDVDREFPHYGGDYRQAQTAALIALADYYGGPRPNYKRACDLKRWLVREAGEWVELLVMLKTR